MALGISIYPKHTEIDEIEAYVKLASKYGFNKCFMCMLSLDNVELELSKIKQAINILKANNFHILVDLSPAVFKKLGIESDNLKFFKELGIDAIRLDDPFDGRTESLLTYDQSGVEINLNISNDVRYLDLIMDYQPKRKKISGSHNFYPLIGSGLNEVHFEKTTQRFKNYNLKTAAFINGQSGTIGAEYSEFGLCTLEQHRNQDVKTQIKYYNATNMIDDIYFSTMFISEVELKAAAEQYNAEEIITLSIVRNKNNSVIENEIIEMQHFYRGDVNGNFIRSTIPRTIYKQNNKPHDQINSLKTGDIIIINQHIDHYMNELQVVLKDIEVEHNGYNLVGKVSASDIALLKYIHPWSKFKLEDK